LNRRNEKVALVTLGCPKNEVDSGVLAGELMWGGMRLVGDVEEADIILVNTCGFIEEAKKESIEAILRAVELKKDGKAKKVYVWGCLSQRYRGQIEKEIPEVDGYFGVEPYNEVGCFFFGPSYRWTEGALGRRVLSTPPHTAYLKIGDGCDHECTFCAIPLMKGKYRSRSVESIVDEAVVLAERGVKELILIAQDTTAYGSDLVKDTNLVGLLKRLVSVEGIRWIRIMYGHPAHVTDELMELIAGEEKICRYLDLPLQHVSDDMLRAMGRGTSRRSVERLVETLRSRIPGLVLRTTFIVGFPGETEAMFRELINFVREVRFERLGAFVFSPEEGTKAFEFKPRIPLTIAEERYRILMEVQQEISRERNRSLESKVLPILVDGYDSDQGLFFGRSEGDGISVDQRVWIRGEASIGEIVPARIVGSSSYDLMGKIAQDH